MCKFKDPSGKSPIIIYYAYEFYMTKIISGDRLVAKEIILYMDIREGRKIQKMM